VPSASRTPAAQSRRARRSGAAAAAAARERASSEDVVETVELDSGDEADDDLGSGSGVDSANRASGQSEQASPSMRGPAPVPLADMISSDDEADDEAAREAEREREVEEARERLRQSARQAAERAPPPPPSDDDDDRVAAVRPGSPAVDRWDSDEEADDDEAGAPCAVQRVQPAQPTQPVEYAEPSGVVVAPGIVADDNFADDDWDDDE